MLRFCRFHWLIRCGAILAAATVVSGHAFAQGSNSRPSESMMMEEQMMMSSSSGEVERVFQRGMRRVIKSLQQADTEKEKERLLELGRKGFQWRYQTKLDRRKRELEELRQQLQQLEADYRRREAAMQRVINLQLESLKLAVEGVIDVDNLLDSQPSKSNGTMDMGMEMEMMGMDMDIGMEEEMMEMEMGMEEGSASLSPADQPIQAGEDPFEGLGGEPNDQ